MKIYLDVCCLNRPFDFQDHDRIRMESETIILILKRIKSGEWILINSTIIEYDVERMTDLDKKEEVNNLVSLAKETVSLDISTTNRAENLENFGFAPIDSFHIAIAEKAEADVLLTTDDQLIELSKKFKNELLVKVLNPVNWYMEMI